MTVISVLYKKPLHCNHEEAKFWNLNALLLWPFYSGLLLPILIQVLCFKSILIFSVVLTQLM